MKKCWIYRLVSMTFLSFWVSTSCYAQNAVQWTGGDGNWNDPTHWNSGSVPSSNDATFIELPVTVTIDQHVPNPFDIGLGTSGTGSTLQLIHGGTLSTSGEIDVGDGSGITGTVLVNGTGGSITSPFERWVNPFTTGPGINTIDLIYSKKAVTLEFLNLLPPVPPVGPTPPPVVITTINFASFSETPNQRAAASLLDAVQLNPTASNLMTFLDKEPFADLPSDFAKISPESLTAFYEISFSGANIQRLSLENRLEDIRNGSGGSNGTGATVYLEDKADGKSPQNPPMLPPVREKRWDFWSTSFGDFVHVDSDFNARGYKFTTGGIDLGIDYRLTDHLAFGLMGNYAHTWSDLQPGNIDVDSARGGIYATYFNICFYINGGSTAVTTATTQADGDFREMPTVTVMEQSSARL
jgi:uncharacterized protein with beta-barrel porin domain